MLQYSMCNFKIALNVIFLVLVLLGVNIHAHVVLAATGVEGLKLTLIPDQAAGDVRQHISVFKDKEHGLGINDVLAPSNFQKFRPLHAQAIDFGFTSDRIWLRLPLHNGSDAGGVWRVVFNARHMEWLEAYWVEGGLSELLVKDGNAVPFHLRKIQYRQLVTDLSLKAGAEGFLIIGYSSIGSTALPLTIETQELFFKRANLENIKITIVYTFLALIIFSGLVFFYATRSKVSLAASVYAFLSAFYMFHIDGLGFQFFWPDLPYLNELLTLKLGFGMTLAATLFTWSFLYVGGMTPRIKWILGGIFCLTLFLIVYSSLSESAFIRKLGYPYTIITTFVFGGLSYRAIKLGQSGANFITAGWLSMALILLFAAGANLDIGPFSASATADIVRLAIVVEITLFVLGVAGQLLDLKRQRDAFMQGELHALQDKLSISRKLIELDQKYSYARILAQAQAQQMASAGHDLRQPLLAIRYGLEEVLNTPHPGVETHLQLQESLAYLEALIVQLFEPQKHFEFLTQLTQEVSDEQGDVFPALVILENVKYMFQSEAGKRQLQFRLVATDARIRADPIVVMRIVSNFVSNAVKYTRKESRILLGCRRFQKQLRIAVYDEGHGILPETLDKLVEPGVRGEGENAPGSGLGLAIAKAMADDHGFALIIKSKPGKGSLFAVDVPLA